MSQSGGLPHIKGKSCHLENNIIISKHRHARLDFFEESGWVYKGYPWTSMDLWSERVKLENVSDANEK